MQMCRCTSTTCVGEPLDAEQEKEKKTWRKRRRREQWRPPSRRRRGGRRRRSSLQQPEIDRTPARVLSKREKNSGAYLRRLSVTSLSPSRGCGRGCGGVDTHAAAQPGRRWMANEPTRIFITFSSRFAWLSGRLGDTKPFWAVGRSDSAARRRSTRADDPLIIALSLPDGRAVRTQHSLHSALHRCVGLRSQTRLPHPSERKHSAKSHS
jgi:hypothetical protein